MVITISILETLLAPKTLWTDANLWGSCGEKYGENGHSWAHLRRKSLQAAQGVMVLRVPWGPDIGLLMIPAIWWGQASASLLIFFPISSNLSLNTRNLGKNLVFTKKHEYRTIKGRKQQYPPVWGNKSKEKMGFTNEMFTFYLSLDIQACSRRIERKERKVERNKMRGIKVKSLNEDVKEDSRIRLWRQVRYQV